MEEEINFRFDAFSEYLTGAFRSFVEEGQFADVTLVSEDQIQTKAHKVVLSAFCPVLKTLLVNNPHSHPLLYLRGIQQKQLQAILNFIYFGETQVQESDVSEFMSISRDLGIRDINCEQNERDKILLKQYEVVYDQVKIDEVVPDSAGDEDSKLKYLDRQYKDISEKTIEKPLETESKTSTDLEENKFFECDQCDKKFKLKETLACHIRVVHLGIRFKCDRCEKIFTTKTHLRTHFKSIHINIKRYSCAGCDYKHNRADNLRCHINTNHFNSANKELFLVDSEPQDSKGEYQCSACSKKFNWNRTLKIHFKKFHENK